MENPQTLLERFSVEDRPLVSRILESKQGDACKRLFNGDLSGYSSFDDAISTLAQWLAFWTKKNPCQIERIIKATKICFPEWDLVLDSGDTYGTALITAAINAQDQTYTGSLPDIQSGFSVSTASELLEKNLPPVHFVVDNLLPQGLALLASPPKYGKSWFVLDLCLSVAAGKPFLGRPTHKCDCLYLALEDSENRLQDRIRKVLEGPFLEKIVAPDNFFYSLQASDLSNGLIDQLEQFIESRPDARLIVIDTLQKVRGALGGREGAYSQDYREVGALKAFADKHGLCVLLVHHLRKMADDSDPFNRISGTNGILGAADTAITLTRAKRTDDETKLSITGRDVGSDEIVLSFNKNSFRWNVLGSAEEIAEQRAREEYDASPIVLTIKKLVAQNPGGWSGTMKDLMNAGKYLAGAYLANTPHALAKAVGVLERPLYEYDGITHTRTGNGTGGGKHVFAKTTVGDSWATVDEVSPFS